MEMCVNQNSSLMMRMVTYIFKTTYLANRQEWLILIDAAGWIWNPAATVAGRQKRWFPPLGSVNELILTGETWQVQQPCESLVKQRLHPWSLNHVTCAHLWDICGNNNLILHLLLHNNPGSVGKERKGVERSMSEAGIIVQWWAGRLLTLPWLYRTNLTCNNTTNNCRHKTHKQSHNNTWLLHYIYQARWDKATHTPLQKSHKLSVDKSLPCLT